MTGTPARPALLVLASTYPRWSGDPEPGFVHELCRRLAESFTVVAVVPSAPDAAAREILDGVQVYRFRYAPRRLETLVSDGGIVANLRRAPWKLLLLPGFVLGQAWCAAGLMRRFRFAVVHAHWLIPQGLIAVWLCGGRTGRVPLLVTSHGADLFALRGGMFTALKRLVVRRATALTVVSSAMLGEIGRLGADVGKVEVMPMGVDLAQRFTPDPNVPRSSEEILFVGRLVEKKGLRYLIEAMRAVLQRLPGASLSIAGFGPEEPALRELVAQMGLERSIRFLGPVTQERLPDLYRRAAVFAAPFVAARNGDREGLGLVVIEALACGCPVVVSDLPAVRDILQDETCLVPPANPQALAEALIRLLGEPAIARERAERMRSLVAERFDWYAAAGRYGSLLSILGAGATSVDIQSKKP